MNIAITGANGTVGSALRASLQQAGHKVRALVRAGSKQPALASDVKWNIDERKIEASKLDGIDAIVHLAGEPIAGGRWTEKKKRAIRDSRVKSTALLAEVVAKLPHPPTVFISGSAIGYYGSRGDEELTEASPAGQGFLAEVCKEWEAATEPAVQRGVRTLRIRTGIVLDKDSGALAKMLTPFKLGLGGKIGSGEQYMSWISLADEVRAIEHCLATDDLSGAVNLVGPRPVTNLQFTRTLGDVLSRPTFMPVPAFMAKVLFGGEMAEELLLSSCRAKPTKLEKSGFRFQHNEVEGALRAALKR